MTVAQWSLKIVASIQEADLQCADPKLHARQLISLATGWEPTQVFSRWNEPLDPKCEMALEQTVARRCAGEPFQYIAGIEGFWECDFAVGPGVLIPRRETELLVETILRLESREGVTIAELGPGSGNIGISVLLEKPSWTWIGVEKNVESLPYLRKNCERLLSKRNSYTVHEGDFFQWLEHSQSIDWIVTNPPYVASTEIEQLSKEVRREPRLALDGGPGGLDLIQRLIREGAPRIRPGGGLLLEMGYQHGDSVRDEMAKNGFSSISILKDFAGRDRVACGRIV